MFSSRSSPKGERLTPSPTIPVRKPKITALDRRDIMEHSPSLSSFQSEPVRPLTSGSLRHFLHDEEKTKRSLVCPAFKIQPLLVEIYSKGIERRVMLSVRTYQI
jgi:hypothetical protein